MISENYRKLNESLHQSNKFYGKSGGRHAQKVMSIAHAIDSRDILDYGCGKGDLSKNLPFSIHQYDPAIPKYSGNPSPADIVVCTDVLEHIEPNYIDEVIGHLYELTKKFFFGTIHYGPAIKTLADGRNAHLIQEKWYWWINKFEPYFDLVYFESSIGKLKAEKGRCNEEYTITLKPKEMVFKEDISSR